MSGNRQAGCSVRGGKPGAKGEGKASRSCNLTGKDKVLQYPNKKEAGPVTLAGSANNPVSTRVPVCSHETGPRSSQEVSKTNKTLHTHNMA